MRAPCIVVVIPVEAGPVAFVVADELRDEARLLVDVVARRDLLDEIAHAIASVLAELAQRREDVA